LFLDFKDNTIVLHFLNLFLLSNIFPLLNPKYKNKNNVFLLDKIRWKDELFFLDEKS